MINYIHIAGCLVEWWICGFAHSKTTLISVPLNMNICDKSGHGGDHLLVHIGNASCALQDGALAAFDSFTRGVVFSNIWESRYVCVIQHSCAWSGLWFAEPGDEWRNVGRAGAVERAACLSAKWPSTCQCPVSRSVRDRQSMYAQKRERERLRETRQKERERIEGRRREEGGGGGGPCGSPFWFYHTERQVVGRGVFSCSHCRAAQRARSTMRKTGCL